MSDFYPFRLIMRQLSPVVLYDQPVHLDALIYYSLASAGIPEDRIDGVMQRKYLKRNDDFGFYHGSAIVFAATRAQGLSATTMTHVGKLRNEQLSSSMFQPNGRAGKYIKINTHGGKTKSRINKMPAYAAPYVLFYGFGNGKEVAELLDHHLTGIGREAISCGWGGIGDIIAEETREDFSLVCKSGKPNRNLPLCFMESVGTLDIGEHAIQSRVSAPYYKKSGTVLVCECERVRSEFMSEMRK